jgi:hypothetical protein
MKLLTPTQQKRIVSNVVAACSDISKLNKQGYDFAYQCSGFIAHYDRYGFIAYYEDYSLEQDLADNARSNQWHNFGPSDAYYEYYMQKRETYNMILGALAARQFMRDHVQVIHVR